MSMADLDFDGDLDVVINNLGTPARLFENRLCGGDHLQIDLRAGRKPPTVTPSARRCAWRPLPAPTSAPCGRPAVIFPAMRRACTSVSRPAAGCSRRASSGRTESGPLLQAPPLNHVITLTRQASLDEG